MIPSKEGQTYTTLKAVVIGGGTGAPVSIRSLLSLGITTNAVVAMADDGGSTGTLRERAGATPPGDVRKCLLAFAQDKDDPFVQAFNYRFEFAENHALGNLVLAALEATGGSFPEAIKVCERLLNCQGSVFPSTLDGVRLSAKTLDGQILNGQAKASSSPTALEKVWLELGEKTHPYEPAIQAIQEADLIVLGPGSLFTSIIPNLLIPGIAEAIKQSSAPSVFVCSLADMQGETRGMSARDHVNALLDHGLAGHLDFVLLHSDDYCPYETKVQGDFPTRLQTASIKTSDNALLSSIKKVNFEIQDVKEWEEGGIRVLVRNLVNEHAPTWHDPKLLAAAFKEVIHTCHLPLT